jgi:hypothetical protein
MGSSWADQNGKDLFLSDVQKQDHIMYFEWLMRPVFHGIGMVNNWFLALWSSTPVGFSH